jgi:hypothetical protein
MSLRNKTNCIIVTFNNKEYYKIEDVSINEYSQIHTVKDIHSDYFQTQLFKKIDNWINLRFVSFDIKNYKNVNLINKLAIFQYLSAIIVIDYDFTQFTYLNNQKCIYKNKITLICPSEQDFNEIPSHVEYLNIINEKTYDYTNIPLHIKFLHFSIKNLNFEQTNLPYSLEIISITVQKHFKNIITIQDVENKIKLPFNCKLKVEFI